MSKGCPKCKSTNIISTQMAVISGTRISEGTGTVQGYGYDSYGNSANYTGNVSTRNVEQSGLAKLAAAPDTELIEKTRREGIVQFFYAAVSGVLLYFANSVRMDAVRKSDDGASMWGWIVLFFVAVVIFFIGYGIYWLQKANSPELHNAMAIMREEKEKWAVSYVCQTCGNIFEMKDAVDLSKGTLSKAEELEKLAQLWKSGVLSEAEFQAEKSNLLSKG